MSLDEQKHIAAQSIMKEVIASTPIEAINNHYDFVTWKNIVSHKFAICIGLVENYATIPDDEEWINTGTPITKEFWNLTPVNQTKWLTEYGKPMPVVNKVGRKEWYLHVQKKNMEKFKQIYDEFNSMMDERKKIDENERNYGNSLKNEEIRK